MKNTSKQLGMQTSSAQMVLWYVFFYVHLYLPGFSPACFVSLARSEKATTQEDLFLSSFTEDYGSHCFNFWNWPVRSNGNRIYYHHHFSFFLFFCLMRLTSLRDAQKTDPVWNMKGWVLLILNKWLHSWWSIILQCFRLNIPQAIFNANMLLI